MARKLLGLAKLADLNNQYNLHDALAETFWLQGCDSLAVDDDLNLFARVSNAANLPYLAELPTFIGLLSIFTPFNLVAARAALWGLVKKMVAMPRLAPFGP